MKRDIVSGWVAALIVLIAAGDASAAARCDAPPPSLGRWQPAAANAAASDQPWFDESGGERRLADVKGTALVVNFWATWCAPCVKEMPALDRLSQAVAADGITVLPLSADREGAQVVRKFYAVNALKHLPVAIDRMGRVARSQGVLGLPTTILIDADGREVGRVVGVAEWDAKDAVAFIRRCLGAPGRAS